MPDVHRETQAIDRVEAKDTRRLGGTAEIERQIEPLADRRCLHSGDLRSVLQAGELTFWERLFILICKVALVQGGQTLVSAVRSSG